MHYRSTIQMIVQADCLEWMKGQEKDSFALVVGSPPYPEKGERYIGGRKKWSTDDWVAWMLDVTTEAVRLSTGMVLWVVNGSVREGRYLPACEGLAWEWYKRGGWSDRSLIWHKNAPPNRKDWFGNDWEFVLAFKGAGSHPPFNWEAIAEPPKYSAGGRFRQRATNGERRLGGEYPKNPLARPRDVLRFTVGGGHLGSKLAHENEAPFPEGLVRHLILACSYPGDRVLDPFAGSGTTLAAAHKAGRLAVGVDYRESQVELSRRRVAEAEAKASAGV
jgi:site-specific DNA-methyltransferase (adenine-specific)